MLSASLDSKSAESNSADNVSTASAGKVSEVKSSKGKVTGKKLVKKGTKDPIREDVKKLAETVQKQQVAFQQMMMKMMQNVMPADKADMPPMPDMASDDEDDGNYGSQADMPGTSHDYEHQISDGEESVASANASVNFAIGAGMAGIQDDPTVGQAKLSKDIGFAKRYCASEEKGVPILQETANSLEILMVSEMDMQLREDAYKSHQTPSNCLV